MAIDIPNANTILIDHADHFGLATLYQLRGRVGRWNRRAYAYFLIPNLKPTRTLAQTAASFGRSQWIWRRDESRHARFGNPRRRRYFGDGAIGPCFFHRLSPLL